MRYAQATPTAISRQPSAVSRQLMNGINCDNFVPCSLFPVPYSQIRCSLCYLARCHISGYI
ncbi:MULTISPECIES: hypothetical protein [Moorena]|uniref:hypothetical protein n=1 Tax=Moorena TaxID=1155738 RepID=UPI00117C1EB8|nr:MULTISPECIES: hypothetical protein [Moorena]NEP28901.1 hypothetical protein [Moorena sp. SIO3I6]